ncbi:MAG: orotidine-5'-phosphate decarboxylase [Blautia sp.]|nr:orotidine-5'-phosphate decarboxylase [Blautia sp.]
MIDRLAEKIREKNAPVVVGLDPMPAYLPPQLLREAVKEHGETLKAAGEAIYAYNCGLIDAVHDLVPAVKPQIAMYEQYGLPGIEAFQKTIAYAHKKEMLVIGDVKRGDIGSTSKAYAAAHLGKIAVGEKTFCPFDEDFATVNPYLGSDGVLPFVDMCNEEKKGIFVLVKTSNPSSGEFQDRIADGRPMYEWVAEKVAAWGETAMGHGFSRVGAVAGATYPEMGVRLRALMPKAMILVPGYGAQGGTAKDLAGFFTKDGEGAIVNSSRGIIAAYKQEKYASYGAEGYAEAARAAVSDMLADIRGVLGG